LWGSEIAQLENYNLRVLKCVAGEKWRKISTEHLRNEKVRI
jgi:Ser/Thr protein kinase RdoA (MazF antagonist)